MAATEVVGPMEEEPLDNKADDPLSPQQIEQGGDNEHALAPEASTPPLFDFDKLDRLLAARERKKMRLHNQRDYSNNPYGYIHPCVATAVAHGM